MIVVKLDYESVRNVAFTVINTTNGHRHSVLYKKDKKEWSCSCKWNTLKETPCSHIREAQKLFDKMVSERLIKELKA